MTEQRVARRFTSQQITFADKPDCLFLRYAPPGLSLISLSSCSGAWRRIVVDLVPHALEPQFFGSSAESLKSSRAEAHSPGTRPPSWNRAGCPLRVLSAQPVTVPACTLTRKGGFAAGNKSLFLTFVRRRLLTHCPRLPTADPARSTSQKKVFCSRRAAGALFCAGIRPLVPLAATPPASCFFAIFLSAAL